MKIGNYDIGLGLILAPMEGVTDRAFRIISKRWGADLCVSEFISSEALIRDARKSFDKLQIEDEERPSSVQIFGGKLESMIKSAQIVEESGAEILDINFGCWVKKVVKNDAGAAFLKDPARMEEVTCEIVNSVKIPVTVKTRLGWDHNSIVIYEVAQRMEQAGASAIAIHCRTRDMGYSGQADWSYISQIKSKIKIPVVLNGDVKTIYDFKRAFDETGCDGVMIGRGSIGNPFIFKFAKEFLLNNIINTEIDLETRAKVCLEHLKLNLLYEGHPRGIYEFRKHYSGYFKNLRDASLTRQKLVSAMSYDEIEEILNNYIEFIKNFKESND